MLPVSIFLCLVPNVTRVYLSLSCAQCSPCLSICVLCPIFPVSIFLCIVPNVTRVYFSVSCSQCSPCLFFFVLCPILPVSIFLCLVPNVALVYLSVSCAQDKERYTRITLGTRQSKINTGKIGHNTQKDRHGEHWAQDKER
jgi:hypothetical protein